MAYRAACEGDDLRGCNNLGVLLDRKGETDVAEGFYTKCCDSGFLPSCRALGVLFIERDSENPAPALAVWWKGCEGGDGGSCDNIGKYHFKRDELDEARRAWDAGCKADHGLCCAMLGMVLDKLGREIDAAKALKRGCQLGDRNACNAS
ncbi:MAG: hypothetical protein JRF63_02595 [Deltaproteobacteria bacterium]|nr:hypothetical protein [Deltaproteobacteria bacterium]